MENIIFYFTGTGNSLDIARNLAHGIGDTEVVPITDKLQVNSPQDFERIGFVFPVYHYHIPVIVERFIKSIHLEKTKYVFGVANYGGFHGTSMEQLRNIIASQGGALSGEFVIRMPGNAIVYYCAIPEFLQKKVLNGSKIKIQSIVDTVLSKTSTKNIKPEFISKLREKRVLNVTEEFFAKVKSFYSNENCNHCGICQKICPVDNITIIDEKPRWDNKCELCMACIQWFPLSHRKKCR